VAEQREGTVRPIGQRLEDRLDQKRHITDQRLGESGGAAGKQDGTNSTLAGRPSGQAEKIEASPPA